MGPRLPIYYKKKIGGGFGQGGAIPFTGITKSLFLGDSITDGSVATAGNSFRELLVSQYSWSSQNLSLGGSGIWKEAERINQATFTRGDTVIFSGAGLNDIRRSNTAQTFNKIQSALRTVLARAFSKSGSTVASGSASVTRSGGFTNFNARSFGGLYSLAAIPGNTACYNTTANATWTWTFVGTAFAVSFSATYPSIARGNAEIRIDGNLVDTITDFSNRYDGVSDGVYDNQRGPDTRLYSGLANTSHTVEVKALSTTAVVVDYFSVIEPSSNGIVFILDTPKVLDYSKPGLDQANDAYINQVNALKRTTIQEWFNAGCRVYNITIMPPYYLESGVTISASDGVHPLNAGHSLIKQGISNRIRYV